MSGVIHNSIPLFSGALAFLPACLYVTPTTFDIEGATSTGDSAEEAASGGTGNASEGDEGAATMSDGPAEESGQPDDSNGSAEGGAVPCTTCGAAPPDGWSGPVLYARVATGEAAPACPSETAQGPMLGEGFVDPGPAVCECECAAAMRASDCEYFAIVANQYGGGDPDYCYGASHEVIDCVDVDVITRVRINSFGGYGYNLTCEKTEGEEIPPFAWTTPIATCALEESAFGCDTGEICIPPAPEGFEAGWCLYKDGDNECPADYPSKAVFWTGVNDTRACTACECAGEPTNCKDAGLLVYADPGCVGSPVATVPAGDLCMDLVGQSVRVEPPTPGCSAGDDSVAEGSIEPMGERTVCCSA